MPKSPMTQEEIDTFKERILDNALQIIIDDGFNNLSMRRIASRLGISATTIYNYYASKDELNLNIRIRGFELLYAMLEEKYELHDNIFERISSMLRAYVEFGIQYPNYYDIMFNLHTPKYLDYVGSDIEPTAFHEKQTALKCLGIFIDCIKEYLGNNSRYEEGMIFNKMVQFWSDLHGFITLYNSRVLHEVVDDADGILEWRISHQTKTLMELKARADAGDPIN